MAELCGRSYIIEHCFSEYKNQQYQKSYQIYVTETLRAIVENTSKLGNGGFTMKNRWIDIIDPPKPVKEDNRPCEEIVGDIWARAFSKRGDK